MSNIYYLRSNNDPVSFSVTIGTIGNPALAVSLKRSGNVYVKVPAQQNADFNIPVTALGVSSDLIGAVLLITALIVFAEGDDLDQAFAHLSMTVTLNGGLDGTQSFSLQDADKTEYPATRSIVATLVVKMQTNQ